MDDWDPRKDDYNDKSFNSYTKGPGRNLSVKKYTKESEKEVQLYVRGIPLELSEDGLEKLFARCGRVTKVKKLPTKLENSQDTFGFVTMATTNDAERAIRDLHMFKIDKSTLRVQVAMSKEEMERKKQQTHEPSMRAAQAFDDFDEEVDGEQNGVYKQNKEQKKTMNGIGPHGAATSALGAGRGQKLIEITAVSPGKTAGLSARKDPQPAAPEAGQPSQYENLTIQVDRDGAHRGAAPTQGLINNPLNPQYASGQLTPVGRGQLTPVGRGVSRGRGIANQFEEEVQWHDSYQDHSQYGRHGGHKRGRGRGFQQHRRGKGRGFYNNYYDSGYGRGFNPMYQGMPYPGYPMPPVYVAPPYMAMGGPHLLQPAYQQMMNTSMMNQSMSAAVPQSMPLPTPAPKVESKAKDESPARQECSVCSKLGTSRCSKCKTPYCSRPCQEKDWPEHKHKCDTVRNREAEQFGDFEVAFGNEIIPQMKNLLEKATGDKIQVIWKSPSSPQPRGDTAESARSSAPSRNQERPDDRNKGQNKDTRSESDKGEQANRFGSTRSAGFAGQKGGEDRGVQRGGKKSSKDGKPDERGCFNCGSSDHMKNECTKRQKSDRPKNSCFNCGATDHMKNECPKPANFNSKCYNCNKMGHLSKDCPEKEENKLKNNQKTGLKSSSSNNNGANGNGEWDDEPVSVKPATSPKFSKPVAESTPKSQPLQKQVASAAPVARTQLPVASMPQNEEILVAITEVTSPGHFYIQMALEKFTTPFSELVVSMNQGQFDSSKPDVPSVRVGEIYSVKFSLDGMWNRAQVLRVTGDNILVQYVDYGNTENTKIECFRKLKEDMLRLPAQGVLCALDGIVPQSGQDWNIPADKLVTFLVPDKPYHATCVRVLETPDGKVHVVVLKNEQGMAVSQMLLAAGLLNPEPKIEPGAYPGSRAERLLMAKDLPKAVDKLVIGQEVPLMIADAKSPIDFSIQVLDEENIAEFTTFNIKFNEACNKSTETEYRPKAVGELVASLFSQEDGWYRAEVTELTNTGAKVVFVDYLNTETVAFRMLRRAPAISANFPAQGIPCCMSDIQEPASGKWPAEIYTYYSELSKTALKGTVKLIRDGVVLIDLKELGGESVSKKVLEVLKNLGVKSPAKLNGQDKKEKSGTIPKAVVVARETSADSTAVKQVAMATSSTGSIPPGELQMDGSKIHAVITHVDAIDGVYVQEIDPAQQKTLAELMLELNESASPNPSFSPKEGDFVAAVYSGMDSPMWYRGQIKAKIAENTYKVLFIDYGNTESVQLATIAPLESKFMSLPAKAVPCMLAGCEALADSETFLSKLLQLTDMEVYVKARNFVRNIFVVDVYTIDGVKVNDMLKSLESKTEESKGTPQPASTENRIMQIAETSLSLDGTKICAKVVLVESLVNFHVHLVNPETDAKLLECLKEMQIYYSDNNEMYTPVVGEYIAALFDDGSGAVWYRAKVLQVTEKDVKVCIIDYGNTGLVGREQVRKLQDRFIALPAVAVRCKLNKSTGQESQEIIRDFSAVESTDSVNVRALSKVGDTYVVDILLMDALETLVSDFLGLHMEESEASGTGDQTGGAANDLVRSSGPETSETRVKSPVSTPVQNLSVITTVELPLGTDTEAVTYVINSIRSFYIQKADDDSQHALAKMMVELNDNCKKNTIVHQPSVGELVAALFVEGGDASWYRGCVLEMIDANSCRVFFLDYGNKETIPTKDIRKLDTRFLKLPAVAIHCKLCGIGAETEQMLKKFQTITGNPMTVRTLAIKDGTYEVEVTQDGRKMSEVLGLEQGASGGARNTSTNIVDHLPKAISPDPLPKKVSSPPKGERKPVFSQTLAKSRPEGKEFTAVITNTVRPNLFHCQVYNETYLQDLKFLSDTMQLECEHEVSDPDNQKFEVGELCCAKFPVDGQWYRASVLEVFPDKTVKVEYVDFGNQTEVPISLLRSVTEDYTRLPLLAFRCSLDGVVPVGSAWTEQAGLELSKFQDKELKAKVVKVDNDLYELELTDVAKNLDLAGHLVALGMAKAVETENEGLDEMEKLRLQNEFLRQQLEGMQAQMAAVMKSGK